MGSRLVGLAAHGKGGSRLEHAPAFGSALSRRAARASITGLVLMARCPNCHAPVESNAEQCAKCSALFTEGGPGWRPVPDSPEEAALMPREERYELPFAKRWPVLAGVGAHGVTTSGRRSWPMCSSCLAR